MHYQDEIMLCQLKMLRFSDFFFPRSKETWCINVEATHSSLVFVVHVHDATMEITHQRQTPDEKTQHIFIESIVIMQNLPPRLAQ